MRLSGYSQSNLALGSDVTLTLVSDRPSTDIDKVFTSLWRYIYNFERSFSRFLPASELSKLNRFAGSRMMVTAEFKDLLLAAKDLGEKTDGLYNPFILPALQRSGYKRSAVAGYESNPVDDYSHRQVVGVDQLQIGDNWAMIPVDAAIDMGGCGKGYLADKLGEVAANSGVANYRFSLGGDIVTSGLDESGNKWLVGIQDANNLSGEISSMIECPVKPFAIATSGTFKRKGYIVDKDWHHIIDPTTLKPAITDTRLVTICAQTALVADVLASCVIIVGSKNATYFAKSHGAESMLLQGTIQDKNFEKSFGNFIIRQSINEGHQ